MIYIILSRTCDGCGDEIAVKLQQTEPTPEEIQETVDILGGMFCITTRITSLDMGIITLMKE